MARRGAARRLAARVCMASVLFAAVAGLIWLFAPDELRPASGSDDARLEERGPRAEGGAPRGAASGPGSFLDDLARDGEAGAASAAGDGVQGADENVVYWIDERGVVDAAADVLGRYRALEGASLATSGYLDLKGNAWGAIVQGDGSWADIVVVAGYSSSGDAVVRIARLHP